MKRSQYCRFVRSALVAALFVPLMGSTAVAQEDPQGAAEEQPREAVKPGLQIGFAHLFKLVVTQTGPETTNSPDFVNLPTAGPDGTAFAFVPATGGLINVRFTAESRCTGGGQAPNWCEVQILIDGVEADPAASSNPPDTFAFDSTDSGTEGLSWEAHAMDRHRCVRGTGVDRFVPVQVQWKVTDFDGTGGPEFWLDDWSLTIETAQAFNNCVPLN